MALYQFERTQTLRASLDEVWNFIASPSNLERITPADMGFKITSLGSDERMYEGLIISYRVRPFPLFTVFRRKPRGIYASQTYNQRISALNQRFQETGLAALSDEIINILVIFNKIKNDQMLLDQDYQYIHKQN